MLTSLLIAVSVFIISAGLLFYARSRRPSYDPELAKSPFTREFTPAIQKELQKLALPSSKAIQASHAIGFIVDQEIHKRTSLVKQEVRNSYEKLIRGKDEAIRAAETKFISMSEDLRVQKRGRRQTETVVRSLSEGRVVVNSQGQALMVNPAAEKILGRRKEEILGKPVSEARGKQQVISFVDAMTRDEEAAISCFSEDPVAERRIRESSAVIEDESGQTRGMISVLPETVIEKEAEETKTEFVASVTHELRSPLICIQKSLDAVLEGALGELSGDQKEYLSIAHRNCERLSTLVNRILDFSRLESGEAELHAGLFSVPEFLEGMKRNFLPWAQDKGIAVETECADETLVLEADRTRLEQVMTNLISNALKFTPRGGKITVSAAALKTAEEEGMSLEFRVKDTGPGIPESEQARLFQKFSTGSQTATQGEKGTGLGLAIVRQIVALHGGRVWVESETGKGSSFIFVIPQFSRGN